MEDAIEICNSLQGATVRLCKNCNLQVTVRTGIQYSSPLSRAGFTRSGAPVQKKCGALHLEKTGDLF